MLQSNPFFCVRKSRTLFQTIDFSICCLELKSGVGQYLLLAMPYQHRTRDRIKEILRSEKKPMTPKEVWVAAQALSWDISHSAIRKLLREMMRSDVRCIRKGLYCLVDQLSETEINTAPEKEWYEGLSAFTNGFKHQRRIPSMVIIRGLDKVLHEERAQLASKHKASDSELEVDSKK
jgi:hypothetical protein